MDDRYNTDMRTRNDNSANRRPQGGPENKNRARDGRSRNRNSRARRRKRNQGIRMILLLIIVVGVIGVTFGMKKYGPTKDKADLNQYFGIENEEQLAMTVDNKVIEARGLTIDGVAYVEYGVVRDHLNSRFYWDPHENVLLYTLPNDIVSVGVGSKEYSVSKNPISENYVILKAEGSTAYIAIDFVQKYTNMDYKLYKNPERIAIVTTWGDTKVATIKKDTQVRTLAGVKSPILAEIDRKTQVTVIENEGKWKKIRTNDGFIGYVKGNALKGEKTENITRKFEEEAFTSIQKNHKINMAWHQVTNEVANGTVLETIANTKGLTTLAPTWFYLDDTQGNIRSLASSEYVNYAHQSKIEVWAVLNDFDGGINSPEETYEVLSYTSKRENLINQLIGQVLQAGIDGINVDIEKISEECGEHYVQFIRELSVKCRKNGIVLSVDNYVPRSYTAHYNRKEQGIVADYVVIMGYDEHYSSSPVSGSVASYDFVKEGIEATLKEVPANKVINAVPFYTRLWREVPKTEAELAEQAGTESAEYTVSVTSEALGMDEAVARIAEIGITPTWDETTKQNYAQWDQDGATYKIWLEDETSIEARLKLMKENKLAGTAAWKLGYERASIWDVILQYVN